MKKTSKIFAVIVCFILLAGAGLQMSAASAPYVTYTYSINGNVLISPHAYTPSVAITSYDMNLPIALNSPQDIFVDENNTIYISDSGNNRVVVCNSDFVYQFEISAFINENGVHDSLSKPLGLFVTEDTIYVCDSLNSRIVLFDLEGNFKDIVEAPTADVMGTDTVFRPAAIVVNSSGMMYIVSSTTYSGIIALNPDGSFQSFLGAQQTQVSLAVRIRRMLFPNVVTESYISTPYKNLTIDDEGLIWATIVFDDEEEEKLEAAIMGMSTSSIYAPIKQLNPRGDDIMVRNGFMMPVGEQNFTTNDTSDSSAYGKVKGPSTLVDIAMGPNGMWSVLDSKRSKIYTYDSEGNKYDGKEVYQEGEGWTLAKLSKFTFVTDRTQKNSDFHFPILRLPASSLRFLTGSGRSHSAARRFPRRRSQSRGKAPGDIPWKRTRKNSLRITSGLRHTC